MRITALGLFLLAAAFAAASYDAKADPADKSQSQQQPTTGWFASVSPNEELTGPVYWANTKDEAMAGALRACQKISSTCSTRPAWTDTKDDLFSVMCCKKPKLGCAIGVGSDEDLARQHVRNIFSDAGYSQCKLSKFLSAKTGEEVGSP